MKTLLALLLLCVSTSGQLVNNQITELSVYLNTTTNEPFMFWFDHDTDRYSGAHTVCPYRVAITFTCDPTNHYQLGYAIDAHDPPITNQIIWNAISPRLQSTNAEITYITSMAEPTAVFTLMQWSGNVSNWFDPFTNTLNDTCILARWPVPVSNACFEPNTNGTLNTNLPPLPR